MDTSPYSHTARSLSPSRFFDGAIVECSYSAIRDEHLRGSRAIFVSRTAFRTCCFAFLVSGFAVLLYQVSWERQIGLLFGHTVQASAVVLASFFLGMAAGYGAGGACARNVPPLLGYAAAELLAALWALAIPVLLDTFNAPELLVWLTSSTPAIQAALRCAFCVLLLLPATMALGATLPFMAALLAQDPERADDRIALAYSWNTAGAFFGVVSASMFMLVEIGVRGSSYFAACLSASIGLGALCLWWRTRQRSEPTLASDAPPPEPSCRSASVPGLLLKSEWLLMSLAAASGAGILVLEVLYTRLFSLVFHNSSHTFGMIVAVFLAGLSAGAALVPWLSRRARPEILFAGTFFCASLAIGFSVALFVAVTRLEYFRGGNSFAAYLAGAALLSFGIMFVPAVLLGAALPLLWRCIGESRPAHRLGTITMVNTAGAGLGALSASFVLLPYAGLWGSFAVAVALVGLLGGALLLHQGRRTISLFGTSLSGMCAVALVLAGHNWTGPRSTTGEAILRRWESAYGWIDVVQVRRTGERKIRQNLHYRLGSTGSAMRERRQAHLPLFLHKYPREVLLLGQGTGITAAGALAHPEVERITVVELVPEVVEAARTLAPENEGIVDHPRVTIEIDDARHFLLRSARRFDVIISDLFVPWESHAGYLYTREHYQIARTRLAPRGLFCQWVPVYQLGSAEFEIIAETFQSVFPEVTLWWGQLDSDQAILALVGRDHGQDWEIESIERRTRAAADKTRDPTLESADRLVGLAAGRWWPLNNLALNTDEHPRVEFLTPSSQGDRRLLKGVTLQGFYDRRLKTLPDIRFSMRSGQPPPDQRTHRVWHRLLLFGPDAAL